MISLLARLFIKSSKYYASPSVRSAYGILCGSIGIFLNILLFAGKFVAGVIARSVAITADAFNNLADAASSVITLLSFIFARQKPDPEHPFGHGRIEYISGLLVSVAIILMGFELFKTSVKKIANPEKIEFSILTAVILVASVGIKLYMSFYNKHIGIKINSSALFAISADSLSDCIATGVVLVSSLVAHIFNINIDGWCGLLVALFILYSGIKSVKETITPLLGQTPDPQLVKSIEKIVLSYEEISSVHDLVIHDYGPGRFMVSLHAEMPVTEEYDIFHLHNVIDNAERELQSELGCKVTIHMDPVATDDALTLKLKARVISILHGLDAELTLHDFRIIPGPIHTSLVFDIVVPYDFKLSDEEVSRFLAATVSNMDDGNYYAVITVDRPYS